MPLYIVTVAIICAATTMCVYFRAKQKKRKTPDPIETLKNALLTLALMRARGEDRGNFDMNYAKYDGTKLPMFSGCSLANTCFTYISDYDTDPFYSIQMEHKANAVNRYLKRNLSTMDQVGQLFEDFVETIADDIVESTDESLYADKSLNADEEKSDCEKK
jgi:hypothetical protein